MPVVSLNEIEKAAKAVMELACRRPHSDTYEVALQPEYGPLRVLEMDALPEANVYLRVSVPRRRFVGVSGHVDSSPWTELCVVACIREGVEKAGWRVGTYE